MQLFHITGGRPLDGTVAVSGAKNAALPAMAATILAGGPVRLAGVPRVADVDTLSLVLGHLGMEVRRNEDDSLRIETIDLAPTRADYDLVRRMRASFCVLGPLLARRGRAEVSLPGGCNIGTRPVDLHLAALAALGADVRVESGYVIARAGELTGAEVHMSGPFGPSVTGTANVMCAATLARGRTVISGAAREPEIVDLGEFLNVLGAEIDGLGTPVIEVRGVDHLGGGQYRIIPDRIEAATLLVAAAVTRGRATVTGAVPAHLSAVLELLDQAGAELDVDGDRVRIVMTRRARPFRVAARPFPGIPTDVQSQLMALAALGEGRSVVRDDVFRDRFMHVAELNRLGARIRRRGPAATITGVASLSGAEVMASDLRASAALVLAGLAAGGETVIRRIYHLDRGYQRLDEKLNQLGARVERRVDDNAPSMVRQLL